MSWDRNEAITAAEAASTISEFLNHASASDSSFINGNPLEWLLRVHIDKFLNALEETEVKNLYKYFQSNSGRSHFLDMMWLNKSANGHLFVVRLAELMPDWIGYWLKYSSNYELRLKCKTNNALIIKNAVVNTLINNDPMRNLKELSNVQFSILIREDAKLLDRLPKERWSPVLKLALSESDEEPNLSGFISIFVHLLDSRTIIDYLLNVKPAQHFELLNELSENWEGISSLDPIAQTMFQGHERLDSILRTYWEASKLSSHNNVKNTLWSDGYHYSNSFPSAIISAINAVPFAFELELGFSIGKRIAENGQMVSLTEISNYLGKFGLDTDKVLAVDIFPMVELWATLRSISNYKDNSWEHKTELLGLKEKLSSIAVASPHLWAKSLPWILVRASEFKDLIQAITLELAPTIPTVEEALNNACNHEIESVRMLARGIQTLLSGFETPESRISRTLVDTIAQYIDGSPIFPHPLSPLSSTWLGSTGVESILIDGVKRACERFTIIVQEQGGNVEEALTQALISEIEAQFLTTKHKLSIISPGASKTSAPILSVKQRPISKNIEEPKYGCDIAWILEANIPKRYNSTWVSLVQVKKSSLLHHSKSKRVYPDSWRIKSKQLDDILLWSQTAVYWLIAALGEVLVIPGRHLKAIKNGKAISTTAVSFTVGYNEVRSAAIPVEQYLVNLLIGQWIGTSSEEVLQFAKNGNPLIRPRHSIEVTISAGNDNNR